MRLGLECYRTGERSGDEDAADRLAALQKRYDEALLTMAVTLHARLPQELPPTNPATGLTEEDRAGLELAIRQAGVTIDLR